MGAPSRRTLQDIAVATRMRLEAERRQREERGRRAAEVKPLADPHEGTEHPNEPTPEQMRSGRFVIEDTHDKLPGGKQITIGKAYRRKPMVDILAAQGLFSDREVKALHLYRHSADTVNRSLIRDSLNRERFGGTGNGPTAAYLTACQIVTDCERAAQSLADILRAVVVDDMSLSQWAIQQSGAIESCRERKGRTVCALEPRQKALAIAKLEIQMAAKRVEAEMAA